MIEQMTTAGSCFLSLTYAEDHIPKTGTLSPRHVQLFLKKLRRKVKSPLRYYLVGEYGEDKQRPHYHIALFGMTPEAMCLGCKRANKKHRYFACDCLFDKLWCYGTVHVGELTQKSAQYIAQYVCKKMTNAKDKQTQEYLKGRYPEFARMSLKPYGIGGAGVRDLVKMLNSNIGAQSILNNGDVPSTLRIGGKMWPIGRYLKNKLREEMGLDVEKIREETLSRLSREVSVLLEPELEKEENQTKSLRSIMIGLNQGKIARIEKRSKIFKQERTL